MGDGNKVYQSKGAKDNATFKQMEQMRKQAVMLDAIEDYRTEMDDAQDKGPGYQGVGDGPLGEELMTDADMDALLEEDDETTNQYREEMIAQMMDKSNEEQKWRSLGHGKVEEITEDEFLATCQRSKRMVCSFFHREFRRCDMLHEIIAKIAHHHIETKFCKLNAQQAPFFVTKLMVQTLPCLIMFEDGKVCGRLDGLDLIGGDDALNNETIEVVLGASGVIDFKPPEEWVDTHKEQYADIIGLNEATRLNSDDDEW